MTITTHATEDRETAVPCQSLTPCRGMSWRRDGLCPSHGALADRDALLLAIQRGEIVPQGGNGWHPNPEGQRMIRNSNGSWHCQECGFLVILFDDDQHYCQENDR